MPELLLNNNISYPSDALMHVTLLKSVDGLHSAHAYLVAHVLNLGCQGRDCLLNLSFSTIELSSEITECITIATDSIHKQGTTIVIVDFVSKTSAIATATKAETITAPTAEAKDKSSQMNQEPSPLPNPLLPFIARRTFGSTPLCWSKGAIKPTISELSPRCCVL